MKPNDLIILNAVNMLMLRGISFSLALDNLLMGIDDSSQKSKKKNYLKGLYDENIKNSEPDIQSREIEKFMKLIGIG